MHCSIEWTLLDDVRYARGKGETVKERRRFARRRLRYHQRTCPQCSTGKSVENRGRWRPQKDDGLWS